MVPANGDGNLGVDLVGRHLNERLVDGDGVANVLEPARHGALGDGLAERGKRHVATARRSGGRGRGSRRGRLFRDLGSGLSDFGRLATGSGAGH